MKPREKNRGIGGPRSARRTSIYIIVAAVISAIAARVIAHVCLGDIPHVMDEIVYTWQAKTFASLSLSSPTLLPRAAFGMWFIEDRGPTQYGIFPPGWPLLLALGQAMHLAAWVNPILHGVTVFALGRTLRAWAGRRVALIGAVFYGLSPQALVLAASRMSHTSVALAAVLVMSAIVALARGKRTWPIVLAGAALGFAVLARPLCAIVIAVPLGAALVRAVLKKKHRGAALVIAAVAAPFAIALLFYNHAMTGDAFLFPQTHYFDSHAAPIDFPIFRYQPGCNALGFGAGHGCEYSIPNAAHSLSNAASNTGDNLSAWFWLACGGPLGLAFAIGGVFLARRGRRWMFLFVPAAIILYGLYWYSGECYGARFYHASLPALVAAAALGVVKIFRTRPRVASLAAALVVVVSIVITFRASAEISGDYWGTDARFAKLAHNWDGPRAVVMVAFDAEIDPDHRGYTFTSMFRTTNWLNGIRVLGALSENAPHGDPQIVFAKYHPALVHELRAQFPDRVFYIDVVRDAEPDRIERYDTSALQSVGAELPRPKDNFDAFVFPPDVLAAHPAQP